MSETTTYSCWGVGSHEPADLSMPPRRVLLILANPDCDDCAWLDLPPDIARQLSTALLLEAERAEGSCILEHRSPEATPRRIC